MLCERCHKETAELELFDYCLICSKNLCKTCAAEGCCGNVPMLSGQAEDHPDDEDNEQFDHVPA